MPWLVRSLQDQSSGIGWKDKHVTQRTVAGMVTVQISVEAETKKENAMRQQNERQQEEDNTTGGEQGPRYNWCKMHQQEKEEKKQEG